jgi:penicillin-binding protein 2
VGVNQIVDVAGRVVRRVDEIEPVPGGSVQLTIDLDLQQAAEAAFVPERRRARARRRRRWRSTCTAATCSRWSRSPRSTRTRSRAGSTARLEAAHHRQVEADPEPRDLGPVPAGSTYKAIVAAAGLAGGLIDPKRRVFCPGFFRLRQPHLRCWKHEGTARSICTARSSSRADVYFYTVGRDLGIDPPRRESRRRSISATPPACRFRTR